VADNTQVTAGTGDTIRDKDRAGIKTQIVGLDVGVGTATEALMSPTNPMPVQMVTDDTAGTITTPSVATTSFTVLAANTSRKAFAIYNDSVNIVYIGFAATTSTTAYTFQLPPGGYYESPAGVTYRAIVTGISAVASGALRVTELV
jgi:hypothetical protein